MAIFNSPQSPINMNNKQQELIVLLLITTSIDLATDLAQQPINFPQSPISMNKQQITLTTLLLIITKIMLRTPLAQQLPFTTIAHKCLLMQHLCFINKCLFAQKGWVMVIERVCLIVIMCGYLHRREKYGKNIGAVEQNQQRMLYYSYNTLRRLLYNIKRSVIRC